MSKMRFLDDMSWYHNMDNGLGAIIKFQDKLSLHESVNKGLGAVFAKLNSYDEQSKSLRSISQSLSTYQKVQSGLDKIMRANSGMAFHQGTYKHLLYDAAKKQVGLLSAVSYPKQSKAFLDAIANVNLGIPLSLQDMAYRAIRKQEELFGSFKKQPWELNTHAFVQAAALSQHAGLVSKSFISEIILNQEWDELEESEGTMDRMGELVNDFFDKRINIEQFYKNLAEFISTISGISSTDKAKNIREKIMYFIGIISFMISVYALKMSMDAVQSTDAPIASTAGHDLVALRKDTLARLEKLIPSAYASRIALKKNILRFKPMCNSKILAKVKVGQIVRVIEIHHKWIFVTFTDENMEEIHSGWVMKKYFDEF